ncbi:lysosome-associated membrane glycoprotein 1-like isoform X3 [Daphnia carinata]|uniref:lysosome-associated membrane glycoprotein 1-like isoform X3 n=1 Tax=Daphnia carinata TaxID=120202 RepID=UPI00257ED4E0|nr:lysosome-associated membrane glycoprotein 1-like isoform X3 [Daphnia carinata]
MHFERIIYLLLICICSGNALVDPILTAVPEMSNNETSINESSGVETTTTLITTPSTVIPSTASSSTIPPSTSSPSTIMPSTITPTIIPSTPSSTITPSTSTPKPNPPHPSGTNWVVVDEETNITCIVVKLSATMIIPYQTINGNVENATMAIPSNATSNGTCNLGVLDDPNTQKISLQWMSGKNVIPNMLTFVFHKNMTSSGNESSAEERVFLSDITVQLYLDSINFPNATGEYTYAERLNSNLHSVAVNNSYRCNSQESIALDVQELDSSATIHMAHLQMEAFRTSVNDKFSSAVDCPADKVVTSDIVPIAVGCALAALVVVVLVAYLIGRRRARQRGYQSV